MNTKRMEPEFEDTLHSKAKESYEKGREDGLS